MVKVTVIGHMNRSYGHGHASTGSRKSWPTNIFADFGESDKQEEVEKWQAGDGWGGITDPNGVERFSVTDLGVRSADLWSKWSTSPVSGDILTSGSLSGLDDPVSSYSRSNRGSYLHAFSAEPDANFPMEETGGYRKLNLGDPVPPDRDRRQILSK